MSTMRLMTSYIHINQKNINAQFQYTIFEKMNCLKKMANIEIIKSSQWSYYPIEKENSCAIDIEDNNGAKVRKFNGKIQSINIGTDKILIVAIEYCIEQTSIEQTFQNTSVSHILKELDTNKIIHFLAHDIELDQFICFDSLEKSIVRLLEVYKILNQNPYLYSIFDKFTRQVIVRNTLYLPKDLISYHNIHILDIYHNHIIIPTNNNIYIGDIIQYNQHKKVVMAILTNQNHQNLYVEDE